MVLVRPRFSLRRFLALIAVVACGVAITVRAYRIHSAAQFIEVNGGDVWCSDLLYSGSDVGHPSMSTGRKIWLQASIVGRVMLGKGTDLWICLLRDDGERFARSLTVLNAESVRFDVLGPTGSIWMKTRCPAVRFGAANGLRTEVPLAHELSSVEGNHASASPTICDERYEGSTSSRDAHFAAMIALIDELRV